MFGSKISVLKCAQHTPSDDYASLKLRLVKEKWWFKKSAEQIPAASWGFFLAELGSN